MEKRKRGGKNEKNANVTGGSSGHCARALGTRGWKRGEDVIIASLFCTFAIQYHRVLPPSICHQHNHHLRSHPRRVCVGGIGDQPSFGTGLAGPTSLWMEHLVQIEVPPETNQSEPLLGNTDDCRWSLHMVIQLWKNEPLCH